jgi:hypothetical protein
MSIIARISQRIHASEAEEMMEHWELGTIRARLSKGDEEPGRRQDPEPKEVNIDEIGKGMMSADEAVWGLRLRNYYLRWSADRSVLHAEILNVLLL